MAIDFVAGDTASKIAVTCLDKRTGAAIDLTGAIVLIRWQSGATLVERPMVVTNAPAGVAEYAFGAGELEYSGPVSIVEGVRVSGMKFEVEITDGNGKKMTNLRTIDVWLRDQLG